MDKKTNLITFIITFTCLILILSLSGCSTKEAEKQNVIAEQAIKESKCPKQGMFQSGVDYCIELCMFNGKEPGSFCDDICYQYKRLDGSSGSSFINEIIQSYKCTKCGECTEEQLKQIEEKRKQKEEAEIAYNKSIEEAKLKKEEEQRIKEEQLKIQEQERLELEKNIESQSEKLDGYVYIKNISGEPSQFQENGIIYEFPYPAEEPTKVPVDLGRRLLTAGHFELVMV